MNTQHDIFAAGETHSIAPHLDPAIVGAVSSRRTIDRDHVGALEVGCYGNNAIVIVVEVLNKDGEAIFAQQFPEFEEKAAGRFAAEVLRKIDRNRQQELFA